IVVIVPHERIEPLARPRSDEGEQIVSTLDIASRDPPPDALSIDRVDLVRVVDLDRACDSAHGEGPVIVAGVAREHQNRCVERAGAEAGTLFCRATIPE